MLILLSPAKNLSEDIQLKCADYTQPEFLDSAQTLMGHLRCQSPAQLMKLMSISRKLADLNYSRHQNWRETSPETLNNSTSRPALAMFKGDVYLGLKAWELTQQQLAWAQDHLRILSGLYGILRPLDQIQPYRLEMGTALQLGGTIGLYDFWKNRLTDSLNRTLQESGSKGQPASVINLASNEYFAAIQPKAIKAPVISPKFLEWRSGRFRFISFSAKRARGIMANFIVRKQITDSGQIKTFAEEGYQFNPELTAERAKGDSQEDQWFFTRTIA